MEQNFDLNYTYSFLLMRDLEVCSLITQIIQIKINCSIIHF